MDDFFKQQAGWLDAWREQQQKLTEQYARWGEDLTKGVGGGPQQQVPTNFEDVLKMQQELFEQFSGFGTDLQQNLQKLWGDKLPKELLQQFNFNLLQEFYKSWLGSMEFPGGMQNPFMGGQNWADPSNFLKSFMKQQNPFFSVFSSRNLVDELQQMFGFMQGGRAAGGDLYSQLFTTYQGFINQLATTGTSQGFDQLLDTFNSWQEQADKYLLAPQVGVNRETSQEFSKVISLSFDYIKSFASMAKLIEETSRKSGNRFQAKLVERSLNNEPPIKFDDFCSLWTKENEAVFLEVFGSEGYAKTQRQFTSAGLRLKMQINKLVEKGLDQTPIALKRDVDLAVKEITELKRELRKSRKQNQELMSAVQIAREAVAASDERFTQLEKSLETVQALAESADKAAKLAATRQVEPAGSSATSVPVKKATSTKRATPVKKATSTKRATPAKENKTSGAKKPAAKPTE